MKARQRGVSIRVIGEKDNRSTAPWTKLRNAGIPVIEDAFDVVNAGIGLMHNKFFVVDGRDTTSSADDWVWTGSWNVTESGTYSDMQNVLGIQDQALARAYTLEFNEMWGSVTDVPNASLARFGSRKRDNTPHHFVIGTTPLELYFSPSDRTTQLIIRQISGAQGSVNAALLTFTRSDIASALVARHGAGVRARVMLDNSTDSGSQFAFLTANGVETLVDPSSAFLHHKYAIIDAEDTALLFRLLDLGLQRAVGQFQVIALCALERDDLFGGLPGRSGGGEFIGFVQRGGDIGQASGQAIDDGIVGLQVEQGFSSGHAAPFR